MARALNVVQTSHTFVDYMILSKAADSGQENPSLFVVEMAKIQELFHLSSSDALDFLDIFLAMNPDPSLILVCFLYVRGMAFDLSWRDLLTFGAHNYKDTSFYFQVN
nr:lysophospholipid acyltransferase LPEAT2 [Tanacetum cinerariifolium]